LLPLFSVFIHPYSAYSHPTSQNSIPTGYFGCTHPLTLTGIQGVKKFLQQCALPVFQPTVSKHWRQSYCYCYYYWQYFL